MREWLASVGVRLVLCLLASGVAFVVMGPIGAIFTIPLYGAAFAKPLWELIAGFLYASKWAALRDVQGRDFMYRGIRIDVLAHSDNFRWLSTADVRKVLPAFPGDASLLNMYPADVMAADGQRGARIRAQRLHEMLLKSHNPEGIKFRNWLAHEIIFPAHRARE